jgi:hypothetical protein
MGLSGAWISMLATHLSGMNHLEYILKTQEFADHKILDTDMIDGLTIGEIGVLYEFSVAHVNSDSRKEKGQFFTPDDVAQFMARQAKTFPVGKWLDPCAGVGNLTWHLVAAQEDPEDFLLNRVVLSDIDSLALLIARTLLAASFQSKVDDLFSRLKDNFQQFDFLSVSDNPHFLEKGDDESLAKIPKHDYVLVNPPYLSTNRDLRFQTAEAGDLYAYFLENIIKTSKGFVSVTPQSFTNASKFRSLRGLLLSRFSNLTIFNFDNVPANLFRGIKFGSKNSNTSNSIRAAITVASPTAGRPAITGLLRWRAAERQALFSKLPELTSNIPLTEDFFPKVTPDLAKLFKTAGEWPKLQTFISLRPTEHVLFVPSSPRYFITALKRPVARASQITLYFNSAKDRDYAYLLLNSSFLYWWWRVRDGGMTLSQQTIKELPCPPITFSSQLIAELEQSEASNKVYKLNSGALQENVKHPAQLIKSVTRHILPSEADALSNTHSNSLFELK